LIRCFLTLLILTTWIVSGVASGQERPETKPAAQGQLDASPALFTVMAAINAVGYDADLESPSNSPLRQTMRRWVAAKAPPSLAELRRFFLDHRQADPVAELSQYVSFALSVQDPPEFGGRYRIADLAPDVADSLPVSHDPSTGSLWFTPSRPGSLGFPAHERYASICLSTGSEELLGCGSPDPIGRKESLSQ